MTTKVSRAMANDTLALPAGVVVPFAGASAPSGWLLCFGQAVSRTTYADLFAAIGTAHGAGDGSTTFALPDMRGRAAVGKDDMGGSAASRMTSGGSGLDGATLGAVGGAQTHTLTEAQMPAHSHHVTAPAENATGGSVDFWAGDGSGGTAGRSTDSKGSGAAHNNTQPSIILNYIIKA